MLKYGVMVCLEEVFLTLMYLYLSILTPIYVKTCFMVTRFDLSSLLKKNICHEWKGYSRNGY